MSRAQVLASGGGVAEHAALLPFQRAVALSTNGLVANDVLWRAPLLDDDGSASVAAGNSTSASIDALDEGGVSIRSVLEIG